MHVRAATATDASAIARIQAASPEAAQWDLAGYSVLVATIDDLAVGFLGWRATASDEGEILNLAVDPSFRRRSVAFTLVTAVPMPIVYLEVRESNVAARALYRKAGFTESGVRFGYYRLPAETAIVMCLKK